MRVPAWTLKAGDRIRLYGRKYGGEHTLQDDAIESTTPEWFYLTLCPPEENPNWLMTVNYLGAIERL